MSFMVHLEIQRPNRPSLHFDIPAGVYAIGSDKKCQIHLPDDSVDPRHASLSIAPDQWWIEDADSLFGTWVNEKPIQGRQQIEPSQDINIGPFRLVLTALASEEAAPELPPATDESETALSPVTTPTAAWTPGEYHAFKRQLFLELQNKLDIARLWTPQCDETRLRQKTLQILGQVLAVSGVLVPDNLSTETIIREICEEAIGWGPIEDFLLAPDVTSVMANGPDAVYIEKDGKLVLTGQKFINADSLLAMIGRMIAFTGHRLTPQHPCVSTTLPDGAQLHAILPPLSPAGPCLTIRKFARPLQTAEALVHAGVLTPEMLDHLRAALQQRKNIIISGGPGSGKTTLLNALANELQTEDRILAVEDAAEIQLPGKHVVRLQTQPAGLDHQAGISAQALLAQAARMRPDRVLMGECTGAEAMELLRAMYDGRTAVLTTLQAASPAEALAKFETLTLISGVSWPAAVIRRQIAAAVHVVVQITRQSDGAHKVASISEPGDVDSSGILLRKVF
jgi:pilus assembly protein CpaF